MRKIMYEDCNNNVTFLKELFSQIQKFSDTELNWEISKLDFILVDTGDFIGGIPSIEIEEVYALQKRVLEEHSINVMHNDLLKLLENIKTIYEGLFAALIDGKTFRIKIFDGDIIEIDGEREEFLGLLLQLPEVQV
ncbi:MAG: hypothetical protein NC489_17450 [Ruminococcus flavefaciens]|nr:hypothetical protein [Ruminococcus flavefaciens]